MIAIIDYGMGNLRSIHNALMKVGGDPVIVSDSRDLSGADELIFLDITASHERRETMAKVIEKTSENVFMPLTVGGGIGNPDHILEVLRDTNASAALAASIFHFREYTVGEVKEYLQKGWGACPAVVVSSSDASAVDRAGLMRVDSRNMTPQPLPTRWDRGDLNAGHQIPDLVGWTKLPYGPATRVLVIAECRSASLC